MDSNDGTKKQENLASKSGNRRRPKLKFGLLFLFVLTLVVAAILSAFRFGEDSGFSKGFSEGYDSGWSDSMQAKTIIKVYKVADLVIPTDQSDEPASKTPKFDDLIKDMEKSVDTPSWESQGGPATVAPYMQNLSLVISQTPRAHDQIAEFLRVKRKEKWESEE